MYAEKGKEAKMTNKSSNFSGCSVFDTYPYVIVAAVSAGSAIASGLCCIFVICLIFLLKKHYFFIQRIILYHCLSTLLRALVTILRFHRLNDSGPISTVCILSGFATQLTNWSRIMDYSVITFTLLMTAVFHKNVARLERFYVVLIFIFPLTFNWIPFIDRTYGRAGPWCWIRNLNYDNCSEHKFGTILRNVIQNVPQYVVFVVLSVSYLSTIIYLIYQRYCKWGSNVHSQERERLKKLHEEVWPLVLYPFGVALLNVIPIISRVYEFVNANEPSYVLWIFSAILEPLQGGFIVQVYTFDCKTIKHLNCSSVATACTACIACKRRETVVEYPCQRSTSIISSEGHETHAQYKMITDKCSNHLLWEV